MEYWECRQQLAGRCACEGALCTARRSPAIPYRRQRFSSIRISRPPLYPGDEIINQDLLIIGERCVRSFGYRGETVAFAERPLTAARSSNKVGYEVVLDQTRLILTKR